MATAVSHVGCVYGGLLGSDASRKFAGCVRTNFTNSHTPSSSLPSRQRRDLVAGKFVSARKLQTSVRVVCRASSPNSEASVVVTREHGKNGKLIKALELKGIQCMELPLIEHSEGPDLHRLPHVLRETEFDWVILTSPEAASVFVDGWREAGSPELRLAVVGLGTGQALEGLPDAHKLPIAFTPSKATAKVLAVELPKVEGSTGLILYPSSAKAGSDLENGLTERGFQVVRLNTYSTETVRDVSLEAIQAAARAPVATFASPTAVRAWVELVASNRNGDGVGEWAGAAACIGSTSAEAARKAGLTRIYHPDSPGIDGWVESVMQALEAQAETP